MPNHVGPLLTTIERPEHRLLLSCCRNRVTSDAQDELKDLLAYVLDWDLLEAMATDHGVLPLLYSGLEAVPDSPVASAVRARLRIRFLANAARNHFLTSELLKILAMLNAAGIGAVPFKGPVLAVAAYGDVALRQFSDLDILIHRRDAVSAKELLRAQDYVSSFGLDPEQEAFLIGLQKDFQLISRTHRTIVELHWSLDPERKFAQYSDVTVWERLGSEILEGTKVPNLSPEDSLLYQCMHGASHCWDRLCWIMDVAALLARCPCIDWESAMGQATLLGVRRRLLLGVSLAEGVLGASIPREISRRVRDDGDVQRISQSVIRQLFGQSSPSSRLGTTFAFHLMVRDSVLDRLRLCARRVLVPDALDVGWIKVPGTLGFLPFLLRPIRLCAKHISQWLRNIASRATSNR